MLQVKVTKMNDLSFKKDLFNPLRTGRKIDEFFSGERGIMPGTNTVITGDPGVGKTTVLLDIIADLNNAGKRVLFVSGEMNQIDMVGYVKRFPKFGDLPILFMGDYADEDPLEVLEMAFEDGYDVVMIVTCWINNVDVFTPRLFSPMFCSSNIVKILLVAPL